MVRKIPASFFAQSLVMSLAAIHAACQSPISADATQHADSPAANRQASTLSSGQARKSSLLAKTLKPQFFSNPVSFEPNVGQAKPAERFIGHDGNLTMSFSDHAATFTLMQWKKKADPKDRRPEPPVISSFGLEFVHANSDVELSGEKLLSGKTNYFIGNDQTKWHRNVSNYNKVRYTHVYGGVDAVFYGNKQSIEYDLEVAPGADYHAISLALTGVEQTHLNSKGAVVFRLGHDLSMSAPRAYQLDDKGQQVPVNAKWNIRDGRLGFTLGQYDRQKQVVIDPTLQLEGFPLVSFLSTSGPVDALATDEAGNIYVGGGGVPAMVAAGLTGSETYAFVTRFNTTTPSNPTTTYFGGQSGSTTINGLAYDTSSRKVVAVGNTSVTGALTGLNSGPSSGCTSSPFGSSGISCGFISGLSGDLSEVSTNLLANTSDAHAVTVDANGNDYVTGSSSNDPLDSTNVFQTYNGGGFVTKIQNGAEQWLSYLGGSGLASGTGIAVDRNGAIYVTGPYYCPFPATSGAYGAAASGFVIGGNPSPFQPVNYDPDLGPTPCEAGGVIDGTFISKISNDGSMLQYSAVLQTYNYLNSSIYADNSGNAYVYGAFSDYGFVPQVNPIFGSSEDLFESFLSELNPTGDQLLFSTVLPFNYGGSEGVLTGDPASGNLFLIGNSSVTSEPVTIGVGADDTQSTQLALPPPGNDPNVLNLATNSIEPTCGAYTPATSDGQSCQSAVIAEIATAPTPHLVFFTFLGGSGNSSGIAAALDPNCSFDSASSYSGPCALVVGTSDPVTDFPGSGLDSTLSGSGTFVARVPSLAAPQCGITFAVSGSLVDATVTCPEGSSAFTGGQGFVNWGDGSSFQEFNEVPGQTQNFAHTYNGTQQCGSSNCATGNRTRATTKAQRARKQDASSATTQATASTFYPSLSVTNGCHQNTTLSSCAATADATNLSAEGTGLITITPMPIMISISDAACPSGDSPTPCSVRAGVPQTFTLSFSPALPAGITPSIMWSPTGGQSVTSASLSFPYTPPANLTTVTITANAIVPGYTQTIPPATFSLTVMPPVSVSITSPTSSSPATLYVPNTLVLDATIVNVPSGATANWSLASGNVGSLSTLSGNTTTYTPPAGLSGTTSVSVTTGVTVAGATTVSTPFVINVVPEGGGIQFNNSTSTNLRPGSGPVTVSAVLPPGYASPNVTWSLTGTGCNGAPCGTLSTTGPSTMTAYTPPASLAPTASITDTLTATSVQNAALTSSEPFTVAVPPPVVISITSPTGSFTIPAGSSYFQPLNAMVSGSADTNVNWGFGPGCSGSACGTITTSPGNSSQATYTPPGSLTSGETVTIVATSDVDSTKSASIQATIYLPPSAQASASATTAAGGSVQYTVNLAQGTGDPVDPLTLCFQNLPTGVTYTVTPSSVLQPTTTSYCAPLPGTTQTVYTLKPGTNSFTITFQTTSPSTAFLQTRNDLRLACLTPLLGVLFAGFRKSRRQLLRAMAVVLILGAASFSLSGCGTGGRFGQPETNKLGSTPLGVYQVTVQAQPQITQTNGQSVHTFTLTTLPLTVD